MGKKRPYFVLFFVSFLVGVFMMVPSGIIFCLSLLFNGPVPPPSISILLFAVGTILCILSGVFYSLFDRSEETESDTIVLGTPGSGKARGVIRPIPELVPREVFDRMSEEEQKAYLEAVQNVLQYTLAHCPQGTGKTKGLLLPMTYADMQQAAIDDACEKIANELSETIDTEW